jgi:hypothetical protein
MMVKTERTYLGKLGMILGSRYITQTDDDRVEYRYIASCGESYLFEVVGDDVYIVAEGGDFDEFEAYARYLAEVVYPKQFSQSTEELSSSDLPPIPQELARGQEHSQREAAP